MTGQGQRLLGGAAQGVALLDVVLSELRRFGFLVYYARLCLCHRFFTKTLHPQSLSHTVMLCSRCKCQGEKASFTTRTNNDLTHQQMELLRLLLKVLGNAVYDNVTIDSRAGDILHPQEPRSEPRQMESSTLGSACQGPCQPHCCDERLNTESGTGIKGGDKTRVPEGRSSDQTLAFDDNTRDPEVLRELERASKDRETVRDFCRQCNELKEQLSLIAMRLRYIGGCREIVQNLERTSSILNSISFFIVTRDFTYPPWSGIISKLEDLESCALALFHFIVSTKELAPLNNFKLDALRLHAGAAARELRAMVRAGALEAIPEHAFTRVFPPLGLCMERASSEMGAVVDKGIPELLKAEDIAMSRYLFMTTIATFFSGVTATMIQMSYTENGTHLGSAVNAFWFSSLIFSISSAINSLLGMTWRKSPVAPPVYGSLHMALSVGVWLEKAPMGFLVVAAFSFVIGLTLFTFSSKQGGLVISVTTAFVVLHVIGLLLMTFLFVSELKEYRVLMTALRKLEIILSRVAKRAREIDVRSLWRKFILGRILRIFRCAVGPDVDAGLSYRQIAKRSQTSHGRSYPEINNVALISTTSAQTTESHQHKQRDSQGGQPRVDKMEYTEAAINPSPYGPPRGSSDSPDGSISSTSVISTRYAKSEKKAEHSEDIRSGFYHQDNPCLGTGSMPNGLNTIQLVEPIRP